MADPLNNLRFPPGLDEGDLLAFVEGQPMPAGKRAAIAAWLAGEPALARVVDGMRGDRDVLRTLPEERAPAGLLDLVGAQLEPVLERQMLLGLAEGKNVLDHPPVSVVRPEHRSVLATLFADKAGRRIAVAAGLLLLVGGSTYFIAQGLTGPGPVPKGRTFARNETLPAPAAPDVAPDPARALAAKTPAEIPQEQDATGPAATLAETEDVNPSPLPVMDDGGATLASAEAEQGPFPTEGIDAVRAAELAQEGRLVIRVKAQSARLLTNPDLVAVRLRNTRVRERAWQVEGEAPAQLASAVAHPFPADVGQRMSEPEPIVFVDEQRPRFQPMEIGPPVHLSKLVPAEPKVFAVQARLEPANLSRIVDSLKGIGGEVEFEESSSRLPQTDAPVVTPQAVLWWTQQPAGWTRWARVPVVVDVQR
jgi:hypothetical protein